MTYVGHLVLMFLRSLLCQLLQSTPTNPNRMGREYRSLYLWLVRSPWLILQSYGVLLPYWSLHSGDGGSLVGVHCRISASR